MKLSIGETIALYRRRAGWSQEELSQKANVSTRIISLLETRGDANPTMETLHAIAKALKLELIIALEEKPDGRGR